MYAIRSYYVKGKPIQNLAASVHARLLKRTELGEEDFQFVLMRYGAERLMYRLGQSEHAANFVLKGAMLVEMADQLRGRCGARQVKDPKVGLVENDGGGGSCVFIFSV